MLLGRPNIGCWLAPKAGESFTQSYAGLFFGFGNITVDLALRDGETPSRQSTNGLASFDLKSVITTKPERAPLKWTLDSVLARGGNRT
jgi:hypothetical protein